MVSPTLFTVMSFRGGGKLRVDKVSPIQVAILLLVEVAILVYMIAYTVRAYENKDTSFYRRLLLLVLLLVGFKDVITCGKECRVALGINFILILIMWLVASAYDKDLKVLLLLTSILDRKSVV